MSETQILLMSPNFKEKIFNGEKRITIRDRHREMFKEGEVISIESNDGSWGCKARLTSVGFYTYFTTPGKDMVDDGFSDLLSMMLGMRSYYPDITASSPNTVLRWDEVFETWEK